MNPLAWLGVALVVAILLMALFGVLNMSAYGGYYGMMGGGSWWWAIVMMGVPGFLLVLILLGAVGAMGDRRTEAAFVGRPAPPLGPLEVLDQRYARGELGRDEYLRIRGDLTRDPTR